MFNSVFTRCDGIDALMCTDPDFDNTLDGIENLDEAGSLEEVGDDEITDEDLEDIDTVEVFDDDESDTDIVTVSAEEINDTLTDLTGLDDGDLIDLVMDSED